MFAERVYLGLEKLKELRDTEVDEDDGYLEHHGILGQKWGVRRYQNSDGSLTPAGKLRYSVQNEAEHVKQKATTKYLPFKETPINKEIVKARGGLTDSEADKCISLATKLFDKASKEEPQITNDILDVVKSNNASMYGLDYRLKQPTSIAAKIGSDSKSDDISMEKAASGINDSIRYTVLSNDESFTKTYRAVQKSLTDKGYSEIKCKNYFEDFKNGKVSHKAVQSSYQSPNGMIFEVQFQTPLSQAAKELKVPLYEEVRNAGTDSKRRAYLIDQMNALAENVSDPPNVFDIPAFSKGSNVKHSGIFSERVYLGMVNNHDELTHHGIKGQKWGERNGPPYPLHRSSEYDTAKDIYDKLDKFDYGCIINGKRYNETNLDEVDWSKYKTTPVDIFEKTKIGTCWDFTNYQHAKLKEAGVDHTTRMIVMDTEDGPVTHTFTTFKDSKGQNYWLEQALYSERGIRPIDDYHDAVDVISKRYDSTGKRPYDVYEFNPDGMDKGLGDQEFFNRATSGDPIFQRKESTKSSNDILKQYENQTLTKDAIREYKSQAPQLSHVRVNKNTTGELYFKDGKLAGMVNTEKKDDGTVWIQGIEVYGDNQGKGLGYSMLDHAVKDLGATNLSVNKKNDRAKMIYDKYGFETYDEDSTMYYMKYE